MDSNGAVRTVASNPINEQLIRINRNLEKLNSNNEELKRRVEELTGLHKDNSSLLATHERNILLHEERQKVQSHHANELQQRLFTLLEGMNKQRVEEFAVSSQERIRIAGISSEVSAIDDRLKKLENAFVVLADVQERLTLIEQSDLQNREDKIRLGAWLKAGHWILGGLSAVVGFLIKAVWDHYAKQ